LLQHARPLSCGAYRVNWQSAPRCPLVFKINFQCSVRFWMRVHITMPTDREIAANADSKLGQHFLVSGQKLAKLVSAAGIRPTDDVLEVGAGIGTVARQLPRSRSLTLLELDDRLIGLLRQNVPHANVVQGDALEMIRLMSFDVLIGNLPNKVTESLLGLLPALQFRVAVLAVGESTDLDQLAPNLSWSEVTRITGDDFVPPQRSVSRIVRVVPAAMES
jgi:phospholipid N-methyltransferase